MKAIRTLLLLFSCVNDIEENSLTFSPQTNYTQREAAACLRRECQIFAGRRVSLGQSNVSSRPFNVGVLDRKLIKSRRMRWAGHVARMGEKRNMYRLLVGKPEGKRPLGRPGRRWIDNIKMDLSEIGLNVVDWIGLAEDRYR
jgi:hypothetical protein